MKKQKLMSALLVVPLLLGMLPVGYASAQTTAANPSVQKQEQAAKAVPGELIVQLKKGKQGKAFAGKMRSLIRSVKTKEETLLVKVPQEQAEAVAKELASDPDVAFVEPNYIYKAQGEESIGDDPDFSQQWGLSAVAAPKAWEQLDNWQGKKEEVTVAVVDTGIDAAHPDLQGRVLPGYNTIEDKADGTDDEGHGTHVAGIIGAVRGNGIGVAGVAGNMPVKLLPIKVLDSEGSGTSLSVAAGIEKATEMGADVINMSLGGEGYSRLMHEAIKKANDKGIVVVVSAGNEKTNTINYYPAGLSEVITVASVGEKLQSSNFSNYGTEVDIAAPGEQILSTVLQGNYEKMNGTSMATPFVSGAAAVLKSIHPDWSGEKIRTALLESSKDIAAKGIDPRTGYGLLQLDQALTNRADKPMRVISPAYGSQVWGKVELDVEVIDARIKQVIFETEAGQKLGTAKVKNGHAIFGWNASKEKPGNISIVIQGIGAKNEKVGEPQKLRVNLIDKQAGGVAVSVVPPRGKSALGSKIIVARSGTGKRGSSASVVYSTHLDQSEAVYLPESLIQPDEKYLVIAQYLDEGGPNQYLQYQVIDKTSKSVALDFNKTQTVDYKLVNGSKSVDIESASLFITPIFTEFPLDYNDIGTFQANLGTGEIIRPHLPAGQYSVFAAGVTKEQESFQLRQEASLTSGNNLISFDLAQAKKWEVAMPDWMTAVSVSLDSDAFSPVQKGKALYVSATGTSEVRLLIEQRVAGKVWVYTFTAEDMEVNKDQTIRLDTPITIVGITDRSEPADKIYRRGDNISWYSRLAVADLFKGVTNGWSNESDWEKEKTNSLLLYDKEANQLQVMPQPSGLITSSEIRTASLNSVVPRHYLQNQEGKEIGNTPARDWYYIPNIPEITNGKYSLWADYSEIPVPAAEKRGKITDLTIESVLPTVSILDPEGNPFRTFVLVYKNEKTGRTHLFIRMSPSDRPVTLSGVEIGGKYQFSFFGSTKDSSEVVLYRNVAIEQEHNVWNLSEEKQAPVRVTVPKSSMDASVTIYRKPVHARVNLKSGYMWLDPGTHHFDVTGSVDGQPYWLAKNIEITESTEELPIEPDLNKMLKISVEGELNGNQSWVVGARKKGKEDYNLFNFTEKNRNIFFHKDEYDYQLILAETDAGKTTYLYTDAKPTKTADGYQLEMGRKFTATLKPKQEQYSPGETAEIDVTVADELGNRITQMDINTKDPDSLMDSSIKLQEIDGKYTLAQLDRETQEFRPISSQQVRPRLVVEKDGKIVAESKQGENWQNVSIKLPDDLEPGTYTLIWTAKLPFELEAKGTITVGEKKGPAEETEAPKKQKRNKKKQDEEQEGQKQE